MILLKYHQSAHHVLQSIDETYPYTFIRRYHEFEKSMGEDTGILWEEKTEMMMPVKFYRRKFFLFAQFVFHPLKKNQSVSEGEEKYFIEQAITFLKYSLHVQRILQSPPFFNFQTAPVKSSYCPFGVYYANLQVSETE